MNPRFNPSHNALISDRKLWLGEGLAAIEAMATLYYVEGTEGTYELYTSIGGQVPTRTVGSLSRCLNLGQLFLDAREREGYVQQLPSYQPCPIN